MRGRSFLATLLRMTGENMQPKISPFITLKIPVFRNYMFGSFVSEIGNQMQVVAVAWQILCRSLSFLWLGA